MADKAKTPAAAPAKGAKADVAKGAAPAKAAPAKAAPAKAEAPKGAPAKGAAPSPVKAKTPPPPKAAPKPPRQVGVKLEPHQVIIRPLVTEKGMSRSTRYNAYAFEVNRQATKDDVRNAVESLFDVRVLAVRTQNRKGKPRKSRFKSGATRDWKKAIVQLDPEHRIDFF